jgi:hypothetical protein
MSTDPPRIEMPDPLALESFRQKSHAERAKITSDAHRAARTMIESQLRFQHPDWNDDQIRKELLRRLIGGAT